MFRDIKVETVYMVSNGEKFTELDDARDYQENLDSTLKDEITSDIFEIVQGEIHMKGDIDFVHIEITQYILDNFF